MKKIFRWQNGVEAGIHADIVPRHVLWRIGVDAKSVNSHGCQNSVKGQLGAK